ncbi:MAG: MFS transporter [Pirellulales bacterium]|nr:MFS transporter [Pirellulales bacterium]
MMESPTRPWYRELNRYHWFVFVVAALGWLFDTMDQQLFNLARVPAMNELLAASPGSKADPRAVSEYGPYATSIFLMGWAAGGMGFGVLGDRIGRAKTMLLTILVYSLFTGLSAFSVGFWDFALYRFLTGLGVGGEFAVGVALVAEVMPDRARSSALGWLQALSAVGNISAALISIGLSEVEKTGVLGKVSLFGFTMSAWRVMFLVGTLPALLVILIRRRLKEPERWQQAARQKDAPPPGSYRELFGDPRWRSRAMVGMLLASSGVIGLWGIGFFSIDLNRSVFSKAFIEEARAKGAAEADQEFVGLAMAAPHALLRQEPPIQPADLISPQPGTRDAERVFWALVTLLRESAGGNGGNVSDPPAGALLARLDAGDAQARIPPQSTQERARRQQWLAEAERRAQQRLRDAAEGASSAERVEELLSAHAARIRARASQIAGRLTLWAGITSIMLNIGAFFGIYAFSRVTAYVGRRPAFAASFVAALISTAAAFWYISELHHVFWLIPLMGFCQLSLFGGYAIYLPELFPTRLRSTGTSFCYNVGRFVAAIGPFTFGYLNSHVFGWAAEPQRYSGVAMCGIFLLGLCVLPFAVETKGRPLPE